MRRYGGPIYAAAARNSASSRRKTSGARAVLPQIEMKRAPAMILRIAIALAVIGGVVWWFKHDRGGNSIKAPVAGGSGSASPSGGEKGGGRVVTVQLAPVTKEDVPIWLEGLGTVAAFQQVTVRPQVDGRLDKVLFTEGQTVKAGDLLAQIDPRPFMVQLHTAQGAFARD